MLDKNTKLILSVALSVFVFSVFYYLVIFLPNKSKKDTEYKEAQNMAQEEARCISSGSTYKKEIEDKSAYGASFVVHRYKYNSSPEVLFITNTNISTSCFMEYTVYIGGSTTNIVNVYTKEFIASVYKDKNSIALSSKQEDSYNSIKVKIFGY